MRFGNVFVNVFVLERQAKEKDSSNVCDSLLLLSLLLLKIIRSFDRSSFIIYLFFFYFC